MDHPGDNTGKRAGATLLCLAAALPVFCMLVLRGASCGHDFDFHLQSWLAVHDAWRHGVLVPHWAPAANFGAGEPRFVFYPPLTWALGAFLGFLLPWSSVPAAFTGICLGAAAWAMYAATRRFTAWPGAAAAALAYIYSPYLLFTAIERTAYGELMAAAWIALLLGILVPYLGAPAGSAARSSATVRVTLRVALLLAALWYTNAPAAVMGCYLVLLAMLWLLLRAAKAHPFGQGLRACWPLAAGIALGCALGADYILPSWYEQHWIEVARAVGQGMRIEDSFLFEHTGEAFHDQVLHTASWIAVETCGAGLLIALATRLRRRRPNDALVLAPLLAVILLLQLPFTRWLWHALPELAYLQFPWRLLLPASAAAAMLLAASIARGTAIATRRARITLGVAGLLWVTGMTLWAAHADYQPCDDEDRVSAQLPLPRSGGFEGADEYTPKAADNGEIQQGLPPIRLLPSPTANEGDDSTAENPEWDATKAGLVPGQVSTTERSIRGSHAEGVSASITPDANAWAVLRLERWPAWQVLRNGVPCAASCAQRDDGLIAVAVPAHATTQISIRYHTTWDVWLGRALSLAALLAICVLARVARLDTRPRLS